MKIYRCDNGKYYGGPQRSCLFCKHCTDVFCELGLEPSEDCDKFEDDSEDPDILEEEDITC